MEVHRLARYQTVARCEHVSKCVSGCGLFIKLIKNVNSTNFFYYDLQIDEESENGFNIEDDDFFQDSLCDVDMETLEEEPEVEPQKCQEAIASTSAVPDATQTVAPSQDFFQTLNGQVSS